MSVELVDAHVHLDFFADPRAVVARARAVGVERFVVPGVLPTELPTLPPELFRSTVRGAALHPEYVVRYRARGGDPRELREEIRARRREGASFVGECGLDRRLEEALPPAVQQEYFAACLDALEGAPLVLHVVRRHPEVLRILAEREIRGGMVHAFVGSREVAARYLARDFALGVGPFLLRSKKGERLIAALPAGSFVLETDAPGPVPVPRDGVPPRRVRSEPADLRIVAERVAALRGESLEELAAHTTRRADALFFANG